MGSRGATPGYSILAKVGIRNFSPQFCNIADHQIDYGVADWNKVAELQLWTFNIGLPQFSDFHLLIFW
jgi:hypothetical protein